MQTLIETTPQQSRDEIHALLEFRSRTALVTGHTRDHLFRFASGHRIDGTVGPFHLRRL